MSISINGSLHDHFQGKRGLRQGDPLSPLTFVLVMDYLSRALKLASSLNDFKFHPLCKSLKLTHLCFADDLMIFCKGNHNDVKRMMEGFNHFTHVTGLHANTQKSQIYIVGVDDNVKNDLTMLTSFTLGQFPFRYLGIPLSPSRWTKTDCQVLVDNIGKKISSWATRHLSCAGKVQLINSVLFSVQMYWSQILSSPKESLKKLKRNVEIFFGVKMMVTPNPLLLGT